MSAACPELVFDVVWRWTDAATAAHRRATVAALMDLAARRGLSVVGGGDDASRFRVTRDGGQAIDDDREALRAWTATEPAIVEATIGPLVDLRDR